MRATFSARTLHKCREAAANTTATAPFWSYPPDYCPRRQSKKGDPRQVAASGGTDQEGATSMAGTTVPLARDAHQVSALLDTSEIGATNR